MRLLTMSAQVFAWPFRTRGSAVSVGCVVLLTYVSLSVIPVRNVVLFSVIEYAWREVSTYDLIRIHFVQEAIPAGVYDVVSCTAVHRPRTSRNVTLRAASSGHMLKPEAQALALSRGHGRFLPAIDPRQKADNLYLYRVASEALSSAGLGHFMVAGTLLGLTRHGGIVPWDDDLDIAVSLDSWQVVKQTLSCVEGFELAKEHVLHWKFRHLGQIYPFLDIFFYRWDENYVWAVTHYTRKTFIYPTSYVFPLTEATFEGIRVPIPRNSLGVARRIYHFDLCKAYKGHIDRNFSQIEEYPDGYSVLEVPCAELSYMYTMYNLR